MYWQSLPAGRRRSYHRGMADRTQIREFLTTRRARITPTAVALQFLAS